MADGLPQNQEPSDPFPEIFQNKLQEVWGQHWNRYNRAVQSGNVELSESIHNQVQDEAARKASMTMRRLEAGTREPKPSDFVDMLISNPRGWGNAPPPNGITGEARSYTPPTAIETALHYGSMPAKAYVGQIDRAGEAVHQAVRDPSLANTVDAGLQTGIAAGSPAIALGSVGLGYLEGARRDMGLTFGSNADAQSSKKGNKSQSRAELPPLPGLTPEQDASFKEASRRINQEDYKSGAERRMLENTVNEMRGISTDFIKQKNAGKAAVETDAAKAKQDEYDRAVGRAEKSRDAELARKRRFSDTEMGKIYDKTGGASGPIAGAAAGLVSGVARGSEGVLNRFVIPGAVGAAATYGANTLPLYYNAYLTEPDNPEREAYQAYARDLPEGHPNKAEAKAYSEGLPPQNPVRTQASKELSEGLVPRLVAAGVEGVPSGILGAEVGGMVRSGVQGGKNMLAYPFQRSPQPENYLAPKERVIIQKKDSAGRTYHVEKLPDGSLKRVSAPE